MQTKGICWTFTTFQLIMRTSPHTHTCTHPLPLRLLLTLTLTTWSHASPNAYANIRHTLSQIHVTLYCTMGAVCITSLHPKFNGSHFGLPPSSIHRMTGWVAISRTQWRMRTAPIVYKKVNACKISTIPEWGLFTKWSRSGLRGTFQVHAGCVAGCVRPRTTHLGRATSCSFCMNGHGWYRRSLCAKNLRKNKPQKKFRARYFFYFSDRW